MVELRVGIEWSPTTNQLNSIKAALADAAKRFYGATEGMVQIESYRLFTNVGTGCISSSTACGGQKCRICFVNQGGGATSDICTGMTLSSSMEMQICHLLFCRGDEYTSGVPRCGHSIMANPGNQLNNFCTNSNHNKDAPGAPLGSTSSWQNAVDLGLVPISSANFEFSNWVWNDHDYQLQVGNILWP